MPLQPGMRLGPYEVTAAIGAGGMGEVYRARDTSLNRDVAIKVLPEAVAGDADRLARFQREAEALAALNHPNIAHVYGLEKSGGTPAIVMELVEGPTLADRIAQGPVPVDEALLIARQIAEALEAAHEQSIIHRDLKPANIKVKDDSTVKVLDFGLAKALEPSRQGSPDAMDAPTVRSPAVTEIGAILGTAAYMAPEQARGKAVDKRADVWAFGCVLFEMLAGRAAYGGESVSETLAAVLKDEPAWRSLPHRLPDPVTRLLRRCLARDPNDRLRDIGDARLEIVEVLDGSAAVRPEPISWRARLRPYVFPFAGLVALLIAATTWTLRPQLRLPTDRFSQTLPSGFGLPDLSNPLAVSPNGRSIVFAATSTDGDSGLFLKSLDEFATRPLAGTAGAQGPFFSPDGASVGFFADDRIWTVRLPDGPPVEIARTPLLFPYGTWGPDGTIVFTTSLLGLAQVAADGSEDASPLTEIDAAMGEVRHLAPQFLPDGRVLFSIKTDDRPRLAVVSLEGGAPDLVLDNAENGRYVASGHLIFTRGANLMAASYDLGSGQVGSPTALGETVWQVETYGEAQFAVSDSGTLVFTPADAAISFSLVWVDRTGHVEPISDDWAYFAFPRVSHDGRRLAVTRAGQIWVYELSDGQAIGGPLTRSGFNLESIWSPDDSELTFTSHGPGTTFELHRLRADGSAPARLLLARDGRQFASSFFGDVLGFYERTADGMAIGMLDGDQNLLTRASPSHDEHTPMFHPKGRWLAYSSKESGAEEIWVAEYPRGRKRVATPGGGRQPLWSHRGDELFFRRGDAVYAMAFDPTSDELFGSATLLFSGDYYFGNAGGGLSYDVHPDDQRFVMLKRSEPVATRINIALNWFEELKARVPVR